MVMSIKRIRNFLRHILFGLFPGNRHQLFQYHFYYSLYGDLREKVTRLNNEDGLPITLDIDTNGITTVFDILSKLSITQEEISHLFVNNKYSSPKKEIKIGDRIGIFPKRMGLIFIEIKDPL